MRNAEEQEVVERGGRKDAVDSGCSSFPSISSKELVQLRLISIEACSIDK